VLRPIARTDGRAVHQQRWSAAQQKAVLITMRRIHRVAVSVASTLLAAGAALGGAMPSAGAATTIAKPALFPTTFSVGYLISQGSGMCLEQAPGGIGAAVIQVPCDGSRGEQWEIEPVGKKDWGVPVPSYQIQNVASGYCINDPSTSTPNGTSVQVVPCPFNSNFSLWGSFDTGDGTIVIANMGATISRNDLITMKIAGDPHGITNPVELFNITTRVPPTDQEFTFDRIS
jgi:hypothetical protein